MSLPVPSVPILSTAGAIPIKNEKGDLTMQKVKVQRYVTGKRPDFAPQDSSDDDEEFDFVRGQRRQATMPAPRTDQEKADRRLRRLQERHMEDSEDDDEDESRERRIQRRRQLHEPELLGRSSDEGDDEEEESSRRPEPEESSEEEEEELDEEEIERRRMLLRQKVRQQREEEELLDKEEDKEEEGSEEESSEYEEYTDSEEEDTGPRLKPVFVRRKDRITIQEKEREELRQKELAQETEMMSVERKRNTIKMIVDDARKTQAAQETDKQAKLGDIDTDEDNDEEEYEAWKVRELRRIKRDREERENAEKDKMELDRLHNMTEEERRLEIKNNPHEITNKASKGKYKYLQKYYHRGAFFLDEESEVYKRDFSSPTLEDHFNKTTLPKVMQVKNFGRSGRTKYTHLVDQDTTHFDSPWTDAALSHKFSSQKGGGMKQTFERPTVQKRH